VKSQYAAGLAAELGYTDVYWYKEGIAGWKKAGYRTEKTIDVLDESKPVSIDAGNLMKKIESGEKLFLVDIRDDQSRAKNGIIQGTTLHYPLFRIHSLHWELPRNRLLVLYDVAEKQAPTASRYLAAEDFDRDKILYLKGGMAAWLESGLPLQ